ncbi:MAG TPA: hypothetical protein VIK40_10040 [Geomonas sp.]
MQSDNTNGSTKSQEEIALREAKKMERRAAMAEIKRLHALDPAKAREAARLWFEQNAEPVAASTAETSAFHRRKLSEADPERVGKAAEALKKVEAVAEKAQKAAGEAVKDWRKKNPNKVKKLNKVYRERLKPKQGHK